ncbi:hypothetical protein [Capnocytophaga sp. oral taxon 412]|uniref:hypothetical protein n=1 Tax=Capnocytophaga sp. oral taxon 412 TaxID=712218 RepID=UPI0018DDC2D8
MVGRIETIDASFYNFILFYFYRLLTNKRRTKDEQKTNKRRTKDEQKTNKRRTKERTKDEQ